jgi:hypothetical protein
MTNPERTERSTDTFLHPHALAAAFFAVAPTGSWFRPADLRGWNLLLAAVVITSIVLAQLARRAWLYRARSRRWKAALDAYAAREIIRVQARQSTVALSLEHNRLLPRE